MSSPCIAAISGSEKGGHQQPALWLFAGAAAPSLVPDAVTYNAAINACEKGVQRHIPDAVTYNAAVSACGDSGQWHPGADHELRQDGG